MEAVPSRVMACNLALLGLLSPLDMKSSQIHINFVLCQEAEFYALKGGAMRHAIVFVILYTGRTPCWLNIDLLRIELMDFWFRSYITLNGVADNLKTKLS